METVLITGGKGMLGRHLTAKLAERGFTVAILTREVNKDENITQYFWDPERKEIDRKAVVSADYVIHLAGAGIGEKRWTKRRRQIIKESRIKTAGLIFNEANKTGKKLKAFISASGTGYYGAKTTDKIFRETDKPADDFLGKVFKEWEEAAFRFQETGIRSVAIRTGVVLAESGGALGRLAIFSKMGIGSPTGSGRQYFPWIHIDDLCNIYIKAVEDPEMSGAYNAAAPGHINNRELTRSIARVLGKPFWFPPVPAFLMKLLYGEMSSILLEGSRVSSDKIIKASYVFLFPEIETALKDLLVKK